MLGFRKLTLVQAKLYLREPMAAFFTLLFGPALLILLGFIFGNEPDPMLGGLGYLDRSVSGYIAMIIGIVGLTAVPITSATRREAGVLRRFPATPLRSLTYFLTDVLVPFVMTLVGVLLLFLVGTLVYNIRFEGNLFSLLAGFSLGAFAFFALGYALVGLVPSARAVVLIGNLLVYPMTILSGATVPLEVMPETVRTILPLRAAHPSGGFAQRFVVRGGLGRSPDRGGRAGRLGARWHAHRSPDIPLGIKSYLR